MTKGITYFLSSILFSALLCCSISKVAAQNCATGETEYIVTVNDDGDYAEERSWELVSADGATLILEQTCGNYTAGSYAACLVDGMNYVFNAYDSYGDGWNGGTFSISLASSGCEITSGLPNNTLAGDNTTDCAVSDLELAFAFTVGDAIFGCTDPNSLNYNACATESDNSCIYPADGLMCVTTGTITIDNATFADSGDAGANYSNNEDCLVTICPATTGNFSTIDFTEVSLETCCDVLSIYNGTTLDCVLEEDLETPMMFRSTDASGCLTVKFTSDGSATEAGWFANISNTATPEIDPCSLPDPDGTNCEYPATIASLPYSATGMTTEGFGDDYSSDDACGSNYLNGDDFVYSYTPMTDEAVSITLTNTGTWAGVLVFDGCPDDANTTCVDINTNSAGNPFLEEVALMAGTTYFIMISTYPTPDFTPFDIDIQALSCLSPTVDAVLACNDGNEADFYIDVTTTFGSGTAYTISNDYDTNTAAAIDGQMTQIGPFPNGTTVSVTVTDDSDMSCTTTNTGLTGDCTPLPAGSSCEFPAIIASLPYNATGMTTEGFGDDYSSADACGSSYLNGDDFVYEYTPMTDETVSITLTNTDTWTGILVFDGCPTSANTTCVGINTNSNGNPFLEEVALMAGTTYFMMISTFPTPDFTSFDIDIQVLSCNPTIDVTTVCDDTDDTSFSIDVTTTFGILASYTISNSYDTNTAVALDGQTVQIGPFPNGTSVDVTVSNDDDMNCMAMDSGLTNDCSVAPSGSTCDDPSIITSLPFVETGMTTAGFGDDYNEANACDPNYLTGDDFVYEYTPTADELVSVTLSNTTTFTGVFIFDGCPNDPNANCVALSTSSAGNPSIDNTDLVAGTTYKIVVSTWADPQSTDFDIEILSITCISPTLVADAVCNDGNETDFYIDVTATFGDGTAYTISNSYDTNTMAAVDGQTVQIGPFPNDAIVDVSLADDGDASCTEMATALTANCTPVPAGTTCEDPFTIASLPYNATGMTTEGFGDDYSTELGSNICGGFYLNGDDFVYSYTPATDEFVNITLTNTGTWVGLFVFDGCPTDVNTTCVDINTNSAGNPLLEEVVLMAGTTYYIMISTYPAPQTTVFDFEMVTLSCINPTVTTEQFCADGNIDDFYLDVTTVFSGGTAYTISNDYDTNTMAAIDGQAVQIGPFPNGTTVSVTVADDTDASCILTLDGFTGDCTPPPTGSICEDPFIIANLPYNATGMTTAGFGDDYSTELGSNICGGSYLNGDDFVYSYTPTADEIVNITLTNTGTWVGLFVFDGCPTDANTTCVDINTNSGGNPFLEEVLLTAGTTYFIMISTFPAPQSTAFDFDMEVLTCTSPTAAIIQSCSEGDIDNYYIDVTTTFGSGTAYTISNDYDTNTMAAVDGQAVQIGPFPNGTTVSVTVTDDTDASCALILDGLTGDCTPIPDNLCDAQMLTVDASCTTGNNFFATVEDGEPAGSCWAEFPDPTSENTVWYSFVAPASGSVNISTDFNTENDDTQLTLFELNGDCADLTNLTEVACDDDSGEVAGLNSIISILDLTAGNTYYIQVDGYAGTVGEFCIEVTANVLPEGNDACIGATPIACGDSVEGSTVDATTIGDPADFCGTTPTAAGIWYTIEGSGDVITLSLCDGTDYDSKINVYSGDCGALECVTGNDDGAGCENGNSLVNFASQAETTYYVLVNGFSGATGNFTLNVSCQTLFTGNDNLCDAIPLTMDADCILSDNTNAGLEANEPSGDCWTDTNLAEQTIWFSFEAPESGSVIVSTDYPADLTDTQIALYELAIDCSDLSSLTQIACDEDGGTIVNFNSVMGYAALNAGQTYYVQVDGYAAATGTFCISVVSVTAPANDACSEAQSLTQNADCQTTTGSVFGAAPSSYPGVDCNGLGFQSVANDDVWYSFVATTENAIIEVDANFDSVIEMFEGDDCDALTSIFCADALTDGVGTPTEAIVASELMIGETYYVRIYSFADGIVADPVFTICVFDAPEPPANDNCDGAMALTQNSTCEPTTATIYGATESDALGCLGIANDDVWFSFEATNDSAIIEVDAPFNSVIELMEVSDCADATTYLSLICQNNNANVGEEMMLATELTVGNIYIIRVSSFDGSIEAETDFTICVSEVVEVANDFCINAEPITCGETISGTTFLATNEAEVNETTCGTLINTAGVWYSFIGNGTFVNLSTCNAANFDTKISVFTGSCTALTCVGGNDDSGGCLGNTSETEFDAVAGTTYFILVHGYNGAIGSFDLTVSCITPADNDNLCNAAPLAFNGECTEGYNTASTVEENEPSGDCWFGNPANTSVWYSFVAPPTGEVTLTTDFETDLTDTQLSIYELTGDCDDLSSLVAVGCDDDGGTLVNLNSYIELTNLTSGATYYVQVDGYNNNTGYFCIAASADVCNDVIVSPAAYVQQECVSASPDVAAAEATIGYQLDGSELAIQWYYDEAYTEMFTAGQIIRSTINSCETQEFVLYAQATCIISGETSDAGTLTLMLLPAPQKPAIIRTDSDCSYLLVSGCPDDMLNPASIDDVAPGTGAQLVSIEVTTAEGCIGTFSVIQDACPDCLLDYDIVFDLDSDNAISPFNYNSAELVVDGVEPLSTVWDKDGYVRNSKDGNNIDIIFANTATWSVTITDADGCEAIVTSDLDPNANGNLGGPLTIVGDAMTPDSGSDDGSIEIFVEGGSGEYDYAWYGPDATVIYPNGDFIDGLASGWYVVYVTDLQTNEVQVGWYWVEPTTRGRGKVAEQVALNAYPNPFDNTTQISFTIPADAQTNIAVYSVDGQKIADIFNDKVVANTATMVEFKAANLPAGMYVVRLQTETGLMQHHKLILNK
ncbi:MAG: T9SS type A sorting domain-containing protein [Chitinophagales bacterium]